MSLFKTKREPYDFSQIIGSCTEAGRKAGVNWDNVNLADGSNKKAQELAAYFIQFHKNLLAAPTLDGLLEPNASYANQRTLELARDTTGKNKVLCTNLSHVSIERACHALRLEAIVLDASPENNYQLHEDQIQKAIAEHGKDIAAIVATCGTTQLGHIERFAEFDWIKQLRSEGIWLHIDAAYGGYIGSMQIHNKIKIPSADSITIDPYKFIGKPGVALLLVEKNKIPIPTVEYYTQLQYTFQTTLPAGPIAAWGQTVQDQGHISGLREIADQCVEIARQSAAELGRRGVPLIILPELSIVPIDLCSKERVDYLQRELSENGFSVGKVHIKGKEYETHGIRIVVTPKVNPELMYGTAYRLVRKIGEVANCNFYS
ncbi:aminotransferase class I/II-fold pyridoxal phosphate-dependent enzyme [Candidatus Woesearchaeota archaeon]|nr:aminotransferase class I/II-fold pyridoxal phosphate-dependent enzyme [Candidatus Woesearchaeota archaeon]